MIEYDDNLEEKTQIAQLDSFPAGKPVQDLNDALVHIYPSGPQLGKKWELPHQKVTIGRDHSSDIVVNHSSVSRHHAELTFHGTYRSLSDLRSTNGSFVNGQQIQSQILKSGDRIKIGETIFKYLMGSDVETAYHEEIYRMTIIDGLTNIFNKRHFMENLQRELARSVRHKRPLSLIIFDIDFFKNINDTHGHLAGDTILHTLAKRIKLRMRKDEFFARYGGEEFAVILPESPLNNAVQFAETIRETIASEPFVFENEYIPVTISLGVSCTSGNILSEQEFISSADHKLYQAKHEGRNRVCY